ncbi:argininosuccinate lyase [Zeaxanthinibacter enoshimensis]|uniref:Argininosuccinate lyase n=1 Tax=Zeaxanthinibacter enoshimensis TaxID=392009 RepID=A0A4R6TNV8_9FLAO|nr:argininosuccinate lyase [Zeaxanthinibacter enoshimensis]TDQ33282.1 argininosuccinate lyase [Zeaxanthinibacter enoshimensis]
MKLWDKGISTDKKIDLFTVGNDRSLDEQLAHYDVVASKAHAKMLGKIGMLKTGEVDALLKELEVIDKIIISGEFHIEDEFEDMHSKIEFMLTEALGDTGKKIHTARSRNDQVLVAMQLFLKDELAKIMEDSYNLFDLLLSLAEQHKDTMLPGYTHLQVAMPSSFGLWFSAYAECLVDDMQFLQAAYRVADQNPLGSAAGYGSSFPIDRSFTTQELGFSTLKYNVVAAQMGRGKVERASSEAMAMLSSTVSRLAMDICLYLSQNFNFISFPDELTTGSSIMPHKKNPDVFELIRAKCNKLQSVPNQIALLTTNLPSGYHRDMQLLKEILLPAIQEMKSCLEMMHFSLKSIQVNAKILDDSRYDYLFSVDTLNEKVLNGLPFRDAYKQMGEAIEKGEFIPVKTARHTHEGSLGNLCLNEIRKKMEQVYIGKS